MFSEIVHQRSMAMDQASRNGAALGEALARAMACAEALDDTLLCAMLSDCLVQAEQRYPVPGAGTTSAELL